MRRREFIGLLGGAAAVVARPSAARAQRSERMRQVGMLVGLPEDDPVGKARVRAFRLGMRDLEWIEGRNIQIDTRFVGSDLELIKKHVAELIRQPLDVILANNTPVVAALRLATNSIPIVFAVVNDPVGQGFIPSLAHPGGNITGFSFIEFELVGKWINLLRDVKPSLSRVALMFNPDTAPYYEGYLRSFKALSQATSVDVQAVHVRSIAEVDLAIAMLGRDLGSGLIAAADSFIVVHREAILKSADMHRVPVISPYRQFVREGSLMSYGPDTADIFRRSSSYVDRVLKGEKPADLPVMQSTKFEFVINLKTAKALGLEMPLSMQASADEVIE